MKRPKQYLKGFFCNFKKVKIIKRVSQILNGPRASQKPKIAFKNKIKYIYNTIQKRSSLNLGFT